MSKQSLVYMPVVQKGTTETGTAATGQLLEVYARAYGLDDDLNDSPVSQSFRVAAEAVDTSAIKHDWDRVAAPLRPVGLYKVGLQAASSVRKLGLTIPRLALYQQYHRQAYVERQRLHLAARKVTDDWRQSLQSTIEGTSAELGLALALLLSASSARPQCVIATGRLGGQPAGLLEFADVEVLKVNSLPEKLRLVTRLAEQHRLPHSDKSEPLLFFTPTHHDVNGQSVAVSDLPEVTALVRWGVKVIPITRLSEAARLLGAQRARWLPQDGRYWWVVGGGIGLLSLLVSLLFLMPPQNLPLIQPELVIQTPRPDDSSHLIDIAKVPAVSADQRLFLKLSEHPGAYRYLLELDGAGKAEIQDVQALRDAGKFDRESNMITLRLADMPPPTYTLLLLNRVYFETRSFLLTVRE